MRISDWKIGKLEYVLYLCVFIALSSVIIYKMLNEPQILPQEEDYPITDAEIIERVQVLDSIPVDIIVRIKYQIVNIVLRHGKVVEEGTHADLTDLHGYYYQLIHNQLELASD